jgi:hypothetical protein
MALLSKGITLGLYTKSGYAHNITAANDAGDGIFVFVSNDYPDSIVDKFTSDADASIFVGGVVTSDNYVDTNCTIVSATADGEHKVILTCSNGKTHTIDFDGASPATDSVTTIAESNDILTNLQEIAELGNNAPEKIDVTVLSDGAKKSISGLTDTAQDLTFKFLYEKAQFDRLSALDGSHDWRVTLPDGTTATFTATPSVKLAGVGVSAALSYSLILSVESMIVFA